MNSSDSLIDSLNALNFAFCLANSGLIPSTLWRITLASGVFIIFGPAPSVDCTGFGGVIAFACTALEFVALWRLLAVCLDS